MHKARPLSVRAGAVRGDMAVRGLVVAKDREYAFDDDTGMRQRQQDH